MKRLLIASTLPVLALLGACGGGNDITTTNDNNVVLNDAQANYAFTNDGDMTANDAAALPADPMNGTGGVSNDATANTTTSNTM